MFGSNSRYEDLRALDGGKDGLDVIECIIMLCHTALKTDGHMFLEVDPCHPYILPNFLDSWNGKQANGHFKMRVKDVLKDFNGKERFIVIKKCAND